jgi:hypothetical protein
MDTEKERRADMRLQTLKMLKQNIVSACLRGAWVDHDAVLCPDSFLHWATQLLEGLKEMEADAQLIKTEKPAELLSVQKILVQILSFLAKMILTSPCYPSLCEFKGILDAFLPLVNDFIEDEKRAMFKLIEALANIGPESDDTVSFKNVSVFVSTKFTDSKCYSSYVQHMVAKNIARAREEVDLGKKASTSSPAARHAEQVVARC